MAQLQLDLWPVEVAALPWGGQSPRLLAQEVVRERIDRFVLEATCGVDNSVVGCRSREAQCIVPDPAQYKCLIEAPSFTLGRR